LGLPEQVQDNGVLKDNQPSARHDQGKVIILPKFGIHGHPNQEAGVLPKYDPSNYIDGNTMATKPLGHTEMFFEVME
jgi:hypothetical protein